MQSGKFILSEVEGLPLVEVAGDVDLSNVSDLKAALERAAAKDQGAVVVALHKASYFDSQTIHALKEFRDRLQTNRQRLLVVAPGTSSARRILKIAGMMESLAMFESIEEAIASTRGKNSPVMGP